MGENMRDRSFYKSSDDEFTASGFSIADVDPDEEFDEDIEMEDDGEMDVGEDFEDDIFDFEGDSADNDNEEEVSE